MLQHSRFARTILRYYRVCKCFGAKISISQSATDTLNRLLLYGYTNHVTQLHNRVMEKLSWWRHQMETFSALLAICAGNSPVSGEFPAHRPVTRSFDVFFDLRLKKRLSKQPWGWWFETLSRPLWRHRNVFERSRLTTRCFPYYWRVRLLTAMFFLLESHNIKDGCHPWNWASIFSYCLRNVYVVSLYMDIQFGHTLGTGLQNGQIHEFLRNNSCNSACVSMQ